MERPKYEQASAEQKQDYDQEISRILLNKEHNINEMTDTMKQAGIEEELPQENRKRKRPRITKWMETLFHDREKGTGRRRPTRNKRNLQKN